MKPIIKWPGGKSREFDKIKDLIPQYSRYIEPFFGGGAVFFELMPFKAEINDISSSLMGFYELVREQNEELKNILLEYDSSFQSLINKCDLNSSKILEAYFDDDINKSIDIINFIISKTYVSSDLVLDLSSYKKIVMASVFLL